MMKKLSILLLFALCACSPKYYLYQPDNATVDKKVFAQQYKLNKAEWDAAFEFLSKPETMKLPAGRYQITENTYATVQMDMTRNTSNYEDHHKKIDLFYIVEGGELVNYCSPSKLRDQISPYSEAKDVEYYKSASSFKSVILLPGKYIILFPSNAHQPMLSPYGTPAPIHKIVVKIPYVQPSK